MAGRLTRLGTKIYLGMETEMTREPKQHLRIPLFALLILIAPALACGGSSNQSSTSTPASEPTAPDSPTATAAPSELPDFAITGYWRDPAEPLAVPPNTTVYFHIQVKNLGKAPYSPFVRVQGPGNYSGGFAGLMPGETKEAVVEFIVYLPDHGGTARDIYFTVDPDNVTPETNETNNRLGPLTVIYGGG